MKTPYTLTWPGQIAEDGLSGWLVYASRGSRKAKGEVKSKPIPPSERKAEILLDIGIWYVRVIAQFRDGSEEPWQQVTPRRFVVTGGGGELSEPTEALVANVDPQVSGGLTIAPTDESEPPHFLEVIEHEDDYPTWGKVIAQAPARLDGPLLDTALAPSIRFPVADPMHVPGSAANHNPARTLSVRRVGYGGQVSAPATQQVTLVDRLGYGEILIAEVDTGAGSQTGFPTPAATDAFEYDTVAGFRMRELPPLSDTAFYADMGTADAGTGKDQSVSPFLRVGVIPTDEVDLGADLVFQLECADRARRAHPSGTPAATRDAIGEIPVSTMYGIPTQPVAHEKWKDNPLAFGPYYLSRHVRGDGSPVHPLRRIRWEYRAATSITVSLDDDGVPWLPYVPGSWVRGRYVQARLTLEDETGWFQVISGDIVVKALVPERMAYGVLSWTGSTAHPGMTVTLPVHPVTGGALFPNAGVVTATAYGTATTFAVVNAQLDRAANTIKLMVWGSGNVAHATNQDVYWYAVGY